MGELSTLYVRLGIYARMINIWAQAIALLAEVFPVQ